MKNKINTLNLKIFEKCVSIYLNKNAVDNF